MVLHLCQHPSYFGASSEIPFYEMEPRRMRPVILVAVRDAGLQHVTEALATR